MQARGRIRHRSEAACARAWGAVLLRCVWRQLWGPKLPLRVSSRCRCHSLSEWRWVAARAGSGLQLGVPAASEAGPSICLLPARTGARGLVAPNVAVTVRARGCCRPAPQRAVAVVSFPPPVPVASTGEGASESVDDRPESPAGLWISLAGSATVASCVGGVLRPTGSLGGRCRPGPKPAHMVIVPVPTKLRLIEYIPS